MKKNECGSALLLTLIALSLVSLLSFFVVLNANMSVKISDNFESQIQATYAALGGLNHARVLVRGIAVNDLLRGPDGTYSNSPLYLAQARRFEFRNPLPLFTALSLDISDPSAELSGMADDGLINTGFYAASNGTALIPATGIALTSLNPYGAGEFITSRYFVKITDNNGEASEIKGDPEDNPFVDGDGIVVVRSVGVSRTFSAAMGTARRLNSASVFEARFKRMSTFDTGPALVVLGTDVTALFAGNFEIAGGSSPGIGTIDTEISDASSPEQVLSNAAGGTGIITGGGHPIPSIQEMSESIRMDRDRVRLLNPQFLRDFVRTKAPRFADVYFSADQSWTGNSAPYLGTFDASQPWNAPGQDPKIVVINGNLNAMDGFSGGGLLIVTGALSYAGTCAFNGLVLVIGSGSFAADSSGPGILGGVVVANLIEGGAETVFGVPNIFIRGNSRLVSNKDAVKAALGLIPVSQISFREIAGSDP